MSGGSGGSSAPTQQTVTNTNIPDYARPYVEDELGRAQALTDTNQNPYQSYGGQRIAGPTALQNQAAGTAGSMGVAPQVAQAGQMATSVGNNASTLVQQMRPMMTNTGQWDGQAAQQYMNPYMQQVVDIQKREAERRSAMQGQQDGANAVASGAYGGTRDALVNAERERNLGIQENDIQAQGANSAWQQAQAQFNADQGRNLQSQMANQGAWTQYGQLGLGALNTRLNAANALENAGQEQYGQQMGIAGLQDQIGREQQATQQAGLDANYQDWVNRQMYPYRQLEFQNNLVHGNYSPNTTTSVYGGYGSPVSQMAGLGTAAYGMSKMMAEGGLAGLPRNATDVKPKYEPIDVPDSVIYSGGQHPFEESHIKPGRNVFEGSEIDSDEYGPIYNRRASDAGAGRGRVNPDKVKESRFAEGGTVPGLAGLLISQIG